MIDGEIVDYFVGFRLIGDGRGATSVLEVGVYEGVWQGFNEVSLNRMVLRFCLYGIRGGVSSATRVDVHVDASKTSCK